MLKRVQKAAISDFWNRARDRHSDLPLAVPEAWSFGATPEHADDLLELVLAGTKTATATSVWDHEFGCEPLPEPGEYSIVLDGAGVPRAVIETTAVNVVPFHQVTEVHAFREGEGDRSLAAWRDIHERFWREHSSDPRGYHREMPVACEEFRLVYSEIQASAPLWPT